MEPPASIGGRLLPLPSACASMSKGAGASCWVLCDSGGVCITSVPLRLIYVLVLLTECITEVNWDVWFSNGWVRMDRRLFPAHWQISETGFLTIWYFFFFFPLSSLVQKWWKQFEELMSSACRLLGSIWGVEEGACMLWGRYIATIGLKSRISCCRWCCVCNGTGRIVLSSPCLTKSSILPSILRCWANQVLVLCSVVAFCWNYWSCCFAPAKY